MNKNLTIYIVVALLMIGSIVVFLVTETGEANISTPDRDKEFVGPDESNNPDPVETDGNEEPKAAGQYISYSPSKLSETGDNIIFFHAGWCPTCISLDKNLNADLKDMKFPDGVNILKTDFDTSTDLRKKYGVTIQHTLVQVDADGNQIAKWTGSNDIDDIIKNIK